MPVKVIIVLDPSIATVGRPVVTPEYPLVGRLIMTTPLPPFPPLVVNVAPAVFGFWQAGLPDLVDFGIPDWQIQLKLLCSGLRC